MTTGKVTGDALTITKPVWNDIIDAKEWYKRTVAQGAAGTPTPQARNHSIVSARNSTGGALRLGEVIELDNRVLGDSYLTNDHLWFDGKKVSFSANRNTFGIMLEPVPSDSARCGKALLLGTCLARVDFSDVGHKFAELDDGELVLKSSATEGDIRILSTPDGTGEQLVFVLIDRSGATQTIRFRNESGETCPAYGVMRVTGYDTDDELITIAKPNSTFQRHVLVNLGEAVANNATGNGTWLDESGKVLTESAAAPGETWGPKSGQWSLAKDRPGFEIVGPVTGEEYQAIARQQIVNRVFAKTYGDAIEQGDTVTCKVYFLTAGALVDSSMTLTVRDVFMNLDEEIEEDTKIWAEWYCSEWVVAQAYCAPDDTDD